MTPDIDSKEPAKGDKEPKVDEAQEAAAKEREERKTKLDGLAKAERARWQERRRLREERARLESQSSARERELAELRGFRDRFTRDPLTLAEEHGLTAERLAQRVIQRGSPEEKFAQLQSEIESLRRERAEAEKKAADSQWMASRRAAEDQFVDAVAKNATKYPEISLLDRDELLEKAHSIAKKALAEAQRRGIQGYRVDTSELADALERQESARQKRLQERRTGRAVEKTSEPAEATGTKGEKSGNGLRGDQAGTPRTLTNGHAAQKGSKPVALEDLPEKEQNRILLSKHRLFRE